MLDNLTTEGLTEILAQLFQPDTNIIGQATLLLKRYFKSVKALENLLILMASSEDQRIRQISCVYLRKLITKLWVSLEKDDQEKTKQLLLTRFVEEPITVIKKNIADVIGQLGMILIPNKEWDDLFKFVYEYTQSEELSKKELAMMLLSVIIEHFSASDVKQYYENMHGIIESYLSSNIPSLKRLAVITVNNLTQTDNSIEVLKKYPNLIPLVLNAVDIEQEDLI